MIIDKWFFGPLLDKADEGGDGSPKKDEELEESEESEEKESEEDEDEEEEEEKEADKDELTPEQQKQAGELFKLLQNPDTQKNTLEILARQAGLLGNEDKTKQEVKKDAKTLVQILEEGLGPELAWLAKRLAPTLEQVLENERGSTKQTLAEITKNQVQKEVEVAYSDLATETKGLSRKYEAKMVKLADSLYPSPTMSVKEYIRSLYILASSEGTQKSNQQKLAEKINRNSKDMPGRIQNSSASGGGKRGDDSRVNVKDAVRLAAQKIGYKGD